MFITHQIFNVIYFLWMSCGNNMASHRTLVESLTYKLKTEFICPLSETRKNLLFMHFMLEGPCPPSCGIAAYATLAKKQCSECNARLACQAVLITPNATLVCKGEPRNFHCIGIARTIVASSIYSRDHSYHVKVAACP